MMCVFCFVYLGGFFWELFWRREVVSSNNTNRDMI